MIEHSRADISQSSINSVIQVLNSGWLIEGLKTKEFEDLMCKYIGALYSTAVTSGTLGIVLALKALDIKKADMIAVPTYICRSVIDAIKMAGAEPFLCDIDYSDYSISYDFLKNNFDYRIKCIILPHMFGIPVDFAKFREFNVPIIEDCAQSIGAEYKDKKCGNLGDISVFSFQATKMITTGEGGMILTNNSELNEKIINNKNKANLNYGFAYNFNFTDIQSAIGIEELNNLNNYINLREKIYSRYYEEFKDIHGIELPKVFSDRKINFFKFIVQVKNSEIKNNLIEFAYNRGIKLKMPISPAPIHKLLDVCNDNIYVNCENIFNTSISLPIYPSLKNCEQDEIIYMIKDYFSKGE